MISDTKAQLRQRVLTRLKEAAAADPEGRRSAALRCLVAPLLEQAQPLTVALYSPLPHEVNLLPLLRQYPRHCYCFPRCRRGGQMDFFAVGDPEHDMQPAAMNIPAPLPSCPLVAPQEIDLLLVPGVAFTAAGDRLGYGGGFYDRYIPRCTRARVLALAFAEQLLPELPTEPHDLRVPVLSAQ